MTNRLSALFLAVSGLVLASSGAQAHTFGAEGTGFLQGIEHPFTGIDHLLAMVTVGLWAAQAGGRSVWLLPLSFVAMMAAGGALGLSGISLGLAEFAIALSLIVLGLAVAAEYRAGTLIGMMLAGGFAIFHGHAHGTELPDAAQPVLYVVGFVLATALLHAAGIAIFASAVRGQRFRKAGSGLVRSAGLAVACVGVLLAAG